MAALATLNEMKRLKPWKKINMMGRYIKSKWSELASKNGLNINVSGIDAIISFNFKEKNNLIYKTFITQEMLKRGFLASNLVYLNIHHNKKIVNLYLKNLEIVFKNLSKNIKLKKNKSMLDGPVCHGTFKRLND